MCTNGTPHPAAWCLQMWNKQGVVQPERQPLTVAVSWAWHHLYKLRNPNYQMPLLLAFHQAEILGNGNQHMPARTISIKWITNYLKKMFIYKIKSRMRNTYIFIIIRWTFYTGCPRRNVPYFGRVFLMLKYTDITQNTYVQSWTVTEIMAREKCVYVSVPRTIPKQLWKVICLNLTSVCDKRKLPYLLSPSLPRHVSRIVFGTQTTTTR
jgi:hypothetical protein